MCHTTPLCDSSWLHPVLNRVSHLCLLPDGFIEYLTMCHTFLYPAGFIQYLTICHTCVYFQLASSSFLRLGQETDKEMIKNRESVYLLLDELVQESPFLTMDLLESCFPYALLRTSYHQTLFRSHLHEMIFHRKESYT